MKKIQKLILEKVEAQSNKEDLKVWLGKEETLAYTKYLENGGNARTAKDKVLAEIKSTLTEDSEWLKAEEKLREVSLLLSFLDNLNIYVKLFLQNGIEMAKVEEFITTTMSKFYKGV